VPLCFIVLTEGEGVRGCKPLTVLEGNARQRFFSFLCFVSFLFNRKKRKEMKKNDKTTHVCDFFYDPRDEEFFSIK